MKITAIVFNWFAVNPESGEEFVSYKVGVDYRGRKVVEIIQHEAMGNGDKWFYDIIWDDGKNERVFNPNQIFFENN